MLEHLAPLYPAIAERILAVQPRSASSGSQVQGSSSSAPAERLLLCLAARTLRAEAAGAGARSVAQLPRFLCIPLLWDRYPLIVPYMKHCAQVSWAPDALLMLHAR